MESMVVSKEEHLDKATGEINMNELNVFENNKIETPDKNLLEVEGNRAMEEVQAAMTVAKRFPRNESKSMDKILSACTRPGLAEAAVYSFPRGGTSVTGPSIRLAECIAQNWGNIQFGVRELSQTGGESVVESFAWDIETNTRQVKTFTVPHIRYSKKYGNKVLTDPRDIYEMVANQGSRRLRACILGIIPGDVIDAAVRQSEITQANLLGAPEEQISKLIEAFAAMGVDKPMLVKRVKKNLTALNNAEILSLKRVYQSLRDGMAGIDDYFDVKEAPATNGQSKADELKDKVSP